MNLNDLLEICPVDVFPDEDRLYERLKTVTFKFDVVTDEASRAHGECDYRLVEKLESSLAPTLGEPGTNGNRWFHLLDFYGDGVRFIEAEWTTLTIPTVRMLRDLLGGEHENFCVAWNVYEDFNGEQNGKRGSIAVFSNRILVTESLLRQEKLDA